MQIINQSREFSKKECYALIYQDCKSLKDLDEGEEFEVSGWVVYEGEDRDGNPQQICATMAIDGSRIAFQSATATESLLQAWTFFADEITEGLIFRKTGGKSKSGRNFVDLEFVDLI